MPRKYTRKIRRRRVKRGGDIESGTVEDITPMSSIPPDPERFSQQQQKMFRESLKPVSKAEAESVFAGPTPEERERINAKMMMDEDPLYKEPFEKEELKIFSDRGGRKSRRRRSRRTRRRQASRRRR